jgi:hypothetical protein
VCAWAGPGPERTGGRDSAAELPWLEGLPPIGGGVPRGRPPSYLYLFEFFSFALMCVHVYVCLMLCSTPCVFLNPFCPPLTVVERGGSGLLRRRWGALNLVKEANLSRRFEFMNVRGPQTPGFFPNLMLFLFLFLPSDSHF